MIFLCGGPAHTVTADWLMMTTTESLRIMTVLQVGGPFAGIINVMAAATTSVAAELTARQQQRASVMKQRKGGIKRVCCLWKRKNAARLLYHHGWVGSGGIFDDGQKREEGRRTEELLQSYNNKRRRGVCVLGGQSVAVFSVKHACLLILWCVGLLVQGKGSNINAERNCAFPFWSWWWSSSSCRANKLYHRLAYR